MKIALKTQAASSATAIERMATRVIKQRLVSQYCHGGIVIGGDLYHATSTHGLCKVQSSDWSPEKWQLIDIGTDRDLSALMLFEKIEGMPYDWFGLLAFAGLNAADSNKLYCFEWCWWAATGTPPTERITPEMLLRLAIKDGAS